MEKKRGARFLLWKRVLCNFKLIILKMDGCVSVGVDAGGYIDVHVSSGIRFIFILTHPNSVTLTFTLVP